jgi:enamine deaminase RidA (YjgF/YER057c/UK114 family)
MNQIEQRLQELGMTLPPPPAAGGVYHPVVITGNYLYVSGQVPFRNDGTLIKGKVGQELSLEEGQMAARQVGLVMLSTIRSQMGDFSRIKRLIKTLGMVNCLPDFEQHPQVINGFSQLMVDLLGEDNGKGARSAVGMTLPLNVAVEIEAVFELTH